MINVGIVQLPGANVRAVDFWVKRSGASCKLIKGASQLSFFDVIILPGVGSFDVAMGYLKENDFISAISSFVENGGYLIGICLGMQIFFEKSEEGHSKGLSLIKGTVKHIPLGENHVPNIGWRKVFDGNNESVGMYYFMHSFGIRIEDLSEKAENYRIECVLCNTKLAASIRFNRIIGVQYHPEKSYEFGDALLRGVINEVKNNR